MCTVMATTLIEILFSIQPFNTFKTEHTIEIYADPRRIAGGNDRYGNIQCGYPFDSYTMETAIAAINPFTNASVPIVKAAFSDFVNNFSPFSIDCPSRSNLNGMMVDSRVITLELSRTRVAK